MDKVYNNNSPSKTAAFEREKIKMWARYLLPVLYLSSVTTSPIIESSRPPVSTSVPPTRRRAEIPKLEDLQRGVGTVDPTDHFKPVIRMENGKMSEQSREVLEQYHINHSFDFDGFMEERENEILEGQLAYRHLVRALIDGDQIAAAEALKAAAGFMEKSGLTLEDAETEARNLQNSQSGRAKRFILKQNNALWDKCIIPYEYGTSLSDRRSVQPAMDAFEYYTGFRFVEWNESVPALYGLSHSNRLVYIASDGCWSYVGNRRWTGQEISCCGGSTCVHEIGHAVGFMHEQMSPLRDDYLRIEWNGIDPYYWSQYYRIPRWGSVVFGYYDPSSVMHYWNGGFRINYKDTFLTMDPDRDFLVARDPRYFYFFKEAMENHNCWDLFCNFDLTCENGGYPSVIGGNCTCACPPGLDPDTRCTTKQTSASLYNRQWPAGSFTTLNTVDGCPTGFVSGWLYHTPPDYIWGSSQYHAKPMWSFWSAEHEFCSRIDEVNDGPEWPSGSYCIYRKGGSCPTGFQSGSIQMDDAPLDRGNATGGALPDGVYGENTRWEFCCRSDKSSSMPINLPTEEPFILFPISSCQEIEGMTFSEEFFVWRSDTADNYVKYEGSLPNMYKFSEELFILYFCYYRQVDKDCGELYQMDASHKDTPLTITSPNYPSSYGNNLYCIYTILAPENTKIQLDFADFDISCEGDSIEIAFSMPGHQGKSFCGDGFEKSIVSSENYMRFTLISDATSTGKGFSASLKLIDDSSLCFDNDIDGRSYSGNVSYTKRFEPCLPWNEVQNCRFHRFSPETFDDNLSENHCRKTGLGTGPWCYTNAETCARDYCDACRTRNCYDIFDDCAALIEENSQFCAVNLDGQALRGCRKTCRQCEAELDLGVTCPPPEIIDGISPSPAMSSYNVGDKVEYICPLDSGKDKRVRTCTSSGEWTDLGFVCGTCPEGWGMVEGKCFKWFEEILSGYDAKTFCEDLNATLATINSDKQLEYVKRIVLYDREEVFDVWIGLRRTGGQFERWDDGTSLTYTQWGDGEPGSWGECVLMRYFGEWQSYSCDYARTLVCMHSPSERRKCADQSSNCEAYIRATPDLCVRQTDFAYANCPYSCGMCEVDLVTLQKRSQDNDGCADMNSNCEVFLRATPDLCEKQSAFANENCQYTCNMCAAERHTVEKREANDDVDESVSMNLWLDDEELQGFLRQPVKRSFDDCLVVPPTTTTDTSLETSTTSTESATTTTSPIMTTTTTTSATPTTTSPPIGDGCGDPGLPANSDLLSSDGDISVGQIYEYRCKDDYALANGDLIRACLPTRELTGSEPSCEPRSSVEQPVNNVNIRRRSRTGSSGGLYTATNQDLKITKSGKITKWRFYSNSDGVISFQVWRFPSESNTASATFIGENTITGTGSDRVRTVEIPEADQISVQDGDVIAINYPYSGYAGIPFTRCETQYEPNQGNQLKGPRTDPWNLVEGNSYSFSADFYDCKTWSVNAYIK